MNSDLPAARDYFKSNDLPTPSRSGARHARHQIEWSFGSFDQGKGDVPVVKLRFRCENCGSRLTDCVVSGSHLGPKR